MLSFIYLKLSQAELSSIMLSSSMKISTWLSSSRVCELRDCESSRAFSLALCQLDSTQLHSSIQMKGCKVWNTLKWATLAYINLLSCVEFSIFYLVVISRRWCEVINCRLENIEEYAQSYFSTGQIQSSDDILQYIKVVFFFLWATIFLCIYHH